MHHTKVKADIGLCKVISDLTIKGYVPCVPLSEHQAYDLIAIPQIGQAIKVQVKYTALKKNGTAEIRFRRNWSDSKGVHTKAYHKDEFDYYGVYCPEKEVVLYVPNRPDCPKSIRFDKPANNQSKNIKWAGDYLKLKRESSETIRRTPEKAKT